MTIKILPIKKSAEFTKIGKKGQKFYAKTLLLISYPSPKNYFQNLAAGKAVEDFCRVGFTVAKTVSKSAVVRNLAKRRLREIFRKLAPLHAKKHCDYIVIARKEIAEEKFEKIYSDLKFCITRIHKNSDQKNL